MPDDVTLVPLLYLEKLLLYIRGMAVRQLPLCFKSGLSMHMATHNTFLRDALQAKH